MTAPHQRPGTADDCPAWCVEEHGPQDAHDVRLHIGEPVYLSGGVTARLCMSVTPDGRVVDGPFVLVGDEEYTLDEAATLGTALLAMAGEGRGPRGGSTPR